MVSRADMGRLEDLGDVLALVRSWEGVEDRGGGTFYLRKQPFLHFHVWRESRRADVRGLDGWVEIGLPEPMAAGVRARLLAVLNDKYRDRSGAPAK